MSHPTALRFTLSTASLFPLSLATTFGLAREAGFDGLDLAVTPEVMRRGAPYVAELSRRFQLPLLSLHGPLFSWPSRVRLKERYAQSLALAQALGIPVITLHLPHLANEAALDRLRGNPLLAWGLERPQNGPCVSWENPTHLSLEGRGLVRRLLLEGSFPITFDFCHAGVGGGDALGFYQQLRERVVHVHLSDAKARQLPSLFTIWPTLQGYLRTHFVEHQRPGQGVLPLIPFLRHLQEDGYRGTVALELSPSILQIWNRRVALGRLRQAVEFCRQA